MDRCHCNLCSRQFASFAGEYDIPLRFRKHVGKRHKFQAHAPRVLFGRTAQFSFEPSILSLQCHFRGSFCCNIHLNSCSDAAETTEVLLAVANARRACGRAVLSLGSVNLSAHVPLS